MIEGVALSDALLHQPPYNDPSWCETNWFPFLVPERNLRGHVYAAFRPNVGAVMSIVIIWSQECRSLLDVDYYDHRVHLPMPLANLDDYRLNNGLQVRMHEPLERWTISYDGFRNMHLEFEARAMMPAVSSTATRLPGGADFSHFHHVTAPLAAASGHIDQTMMMHGELVLDGKRIEIAWPSNRDHSWSSRPEFAHGCGYFDEGFWGEEFAFHVQTKNTELERAAVTNGYVLDHGELIALKAGEGRYELDGWFTKKLVYELEGVNGQTYVIQGRPTSSIVLPTWPNQFNIAGVTEWTTNGESGWGEYKWHWETTEMLARGGATPARNASEPK